MSFDEKAQMKALQKEILKIEQVFSAFTKIKSNDADALDKFNKGLKKLPPGQIIGTAVEELREKITSFIQQSQQTRMESFGRIEAEFIRNTRKQHKSVREQARGWRIGPLEVEMDREQSRVRFLYNREVLLPWQSVFCKEDIEKSELKALDMLGKSLLPEPTLIKTCWETYQNLKILSNRPGANHSELVPIDAFYRELRAQLVRTQLETKKPDSKLNYIEMPRWAFLYNLDCYRTIRFPDQTPRLGFQAGSQMEVSKGMGFVLNGLDALEDYKTFCYVIAVGS
ncbi:MAG: hypothetical protein GXY40_13265 [Syntrophomonadaceae bacterium]|nr:hypothetical protein [Syntrophomonadaceae bacterium]